MKQKKKCFTLLELGIVIVVSIVVAVLILFAIFTGVTRHASNSVREKARQTNCVNNLSQIGKGFFQYAMSFDDWYPTVRKYKTKRVSESQSWGNYKHDIPIDGGKWLGPESYKALTLLRDADLLTDPRAFVCPSNEKVTAAIRNQSLSGHVSYQWCDGIVGGDSFATLVSADGADNHGNNGYFVRGDGSVGPAQGIRSVKWYQTDSVKNYCKSPTDLPSYSF